MRIDHRATPEVARTQARERVKKAGFIYQGVHIPITSADAMAMLQVRAAFEFGETDTVIEFSNGSKLPITATEFAAFARTFVASRNALFTESGKHPKTK
jgi:hypothetical protein